MFHACIATASFEAAVADAVAAPLVPAAVGMLLPELCILVCTLPVVCADMLKLVEWMIPVGSGKVLPFVPKLEHSASHRELVVSNDGMHP